MKMCEIAQIPYDKKHMQENRESYDYATKHILKNYRYFRNLFEEKKKNIEQIKVHIPQNSKMTSLEQLMWKAACENIPVADIENLMIMTEFRIAVEMLKMLPKSGELCHMIIDIYYMSGDAISTDYAAAFVGIGASRFFGLKEVAIKYLSYVLWGISEDEAAQLEEINRDIMRNALETKLNEIIKRG